MDNTIIWWGVAFCLTQSAMFSGLNLAFFGVSRLQLEVESTTSARARRVLMMRRDSNFLLTTILWGNVSINVLLTILTNSALTGVAAFLFSTVLITFLGEIGPQAYFSRNPLRMAALLAPVLRLYQFLLFPVAKPTAMALDWWLGKESAQFYREHVIRDLLLKHVQEENSDVGRVEGIGALNFLDIDDLAAHTEGERVDPESIVMLPTDVDLPRFPPFKRLPEDPLMMASAAAEFGAAVAATPIAAPTVPIIGNVTGRPLATPEAIRTELKAQLTSAVAWTESMTYLLAQGVDTFVEVGSGDVLLSLIKRIDRQANRVKFEIGG